MDISLLKNIENKLKESGVVDNLRDELKDFFTNDSRKYSNYWKDCQKFIEYNIAENIGISRWATDISYKGEIKSAINDSILELTEKEGVLYRKKFIPNGSLDSQTVKVDKFENGEVEHIILSANDIPEEFRDKDIIFQYDSNGEVKVRIDLKEEIVKNASEKLQDLKIKEDEKLKDYKKENHIYKAIEDDGYIFLKDITENRGFVIEDIDFVTQYYQGDGMYQVKNGEYQKID